MTSLHQVLTIDIYFKVSVVTAFHFYDSYKKILSHESLPSIVWDFFHYLLQGSGAETPGSSFFDYLRYLFLPLAKSPGRAKMGLKQLIPLLIRRHRRTFDKKAIVQMKCKRAVRSFVRISVTEGQQPRVLEGPEIFRKRKMKETP